MAAYVITNLCEFVQNVFFSSYNRTRESKRSREREGETKEVKRNHSKWNSSFTVHSELFILFSYRSLKNRNNFLHKKYVCVFMCVKYTSWLMLVHLLNVEKKYYFELNCARRRFARSRKFLGQQRKYNFLFLFLLLLFSVWLKQTRKK